MNCPICNKGGLPNEAVSCPQCDTDFAHIRALEKLPLELKENKSKKFLNVILFVIILLLSLYIAIQPFKSSKEVQNIVNKERIDSLDILIHENKKYVSIIDSLNKASYSNYFIYTITRGDDVSRIRKMFSIQDTQLSDFLLLNKIANEDFIREGQTLKIPVIEKLK
ncbi:MAG: LysM peptidoglycan-binding domain-containing protein [Ignavibacteria bacterium]|nr:LysM peptidoglycan-binding domain-containing protein [Ignavibacteria bacterium]